MAVTIITMLPSATYTSDHIHPTLNQLKIMCSYTIALGVAKNYLKERVMSYCNSQGTVDTSYSPCRAGVHRRRDVAEGGLEEGQGAVGDLETSPQFLSKMF